MLYSILQFNTGSTFNKRYGEKLRGFFASLYRNNDLFHNHDKNGSDIYRYPLIQYKVIAGNLVIVGINAGADLVRHEFVKHETLDLDGDVLENFEISLKINNVEFAVHDTLHSYSFDSIWLPLNEENYRKYMRGELNLDTALQNNLLSDLKGLGIFADKRIMVKGNFQKREVMLENKRMVGFTGEFVCNVKIPSLLGTGKRKSIGFGTIVERK